MKVCTVNPDGKSDWEMANGRMFSVRLNGSRIEGVIAADENGGEVHFEVFDTDGQKLNPRVFSKACGNVKVEQFSSQLYLG